MAQLPPKIPNVTAQDHHNYHHHHHHQHDQIPNSHQWSEFNYNGLSTEGHNKYLNMNSLNLNPTSASSQQHSNPSWVDEFMEFSTAKRGAHRRSVSDSSVAFIEAGAVVPSFLTAAAAVGVDTSQRGHQRHHDQFEKFDDEQFMSMFSNELGSCSNPSSTSDNNSTNDQNRTAEGNKGEAEREKADEVESSCKGNEKEGQQQQQQQQQQNGQLNNAEGNMCGNAGAGENGNGGTDVEQHQQAVDPKRVKRILANRQSAQRSRVRKLQYISELERSVTALQSEVSVLSPRVAFLDHQRMMLNVDNSSLKAKIAALAQDKIFKDAHQEALKREIERLRQVYYQQNLKKTEGTITPPSSSPVPSPAIQPPPPDIKDETEHLIG